MAWKRAAKLWGQSVYGSYLGTGGVIGVAIAGGMGLAGVAAWPYVLGASVLATAGGFGYDAYLLLERRMEILVGRGRPFKEPYPDTMNGRPVTKMQFRIGVKNLGGNSIEGVRVTLDGEQPIIRDTGLELQGHPSVSEFRLDQEPRYVDVALETFYADTGERVGALICYACRRTIAGYATDIGGQRLSFKVHVQAKDTQSETKAGEIYVDSSGRMDVRFS